MDRDEIARRVASIVVDKLDVTVDQVTDGAKLTEDLGADSLDKAEIVMECEAEFDLSIPDDEEGIRTVGDAVDFIAELIKKKESEG